MVVWQGRGGRVAGAQWSCGRGAVIVWQGRGGRVVGAR